MVEEKKKRGRPNKAKQSPAPKTGIKEEVKSPPTIEEAVKAQEKETVKEVHHYHRREGFNLGRIFFGLLIAAVGLLFLADNLGLIKFSLDISLWDLWPLLLIYIGLSMLTTRSWVATVFSVFLTLLVIALLFIFVLARVSFNESGGINIEVFPSRSMVGSGKIITENRSVRNFNRVSFTSPGRLHLKQGDRESLRIEGDDNVVKEIETAVRGQELTIGMTQFWLFSFKPSKPVDYYLTVKDLKELSVSGASQLDCDRLETDTLDIEITGAGTAKMGIQTDELTCKISGMGKFDVSGYARKQSLDASGAVDYNAEDLESEECEIEISGAGQANVRVSDRLDVNVSGAGNVSYIGDPVVEKNISGAGKVTQIDSL